MKNKYISFVALAVAALATSCASDDLAEQKQEETKPQTVTLTASVNDVQTRVGMTKDDSKASFYWHKNDAISVLTTSGSTYNNEKFTTDVETGKESATFTGNVTGTVGKYAVYPYSDKHQFTSATKMTYNLPDSYNYTTVGSNIFSKTENSTTTYPSNPTNMPMLGTIDGNSIRFKCLGGLAVIRIDQMPAESGTLTVSADQQLSGDFTVDDLSADGAEIATTTENVSDDNKKVTFNFDNATKGGIGVFYLPLATGSYSNVKIEVVCNGTTQTINYGNLYMARKSVTAIPLYATGTDGALTKFSKIDGNVYTLNGHEFVDLGLSVLWAKTNVGAATETANGNYYAWGEVTAYNEKTDWGTGEVKTNYAWDTYKYGKEKNLTKYNDSDGKTVLAPSDDAATVNWGAGVRMPTQEEAEEIAKNCTFDVNSEQTCWTVTGKDDYSAPSILFPPGSAYSESSLSKDGETVFCCWLSTRYDSEAKYAYVLYIYGAVQVPYQDRYVGCNVRAVTEKP